jgi:hypothetical protein
MTTKLIAETMYLKNHLKSFPVAEYKIPFSLGSTIEDK